MNSVVRKWIKRLTFISAIIPILIILGFMGAMQFIDFNRYKPQIEHRVSQTLGLSFKIKGDVSIHLLPFGLSFDQAVLLSDARFKNMPLLNIEKTQLNFSLLNLFLEKKLTLQGLSLTKPHIHLRENKLGEKNWQPIRKLVQINRLKPSGFHTVVYQSVSNAVASSSQSSPQTVSKNLPIWKLQDLVIDSGGIDFESQVSHEKIRVDHFDLLALDLKPQVPFKVSVNFNLENVNQKQHIESQLNTFVQVDRNLKNWALSDWQAYAQLSLPSEMQIPDSRLNTTGSLFKFNTQTHQFELHNAHFNYLNSHLSLQLSGQLGETYQIKGAVNLAHLNLPKMMHQLHQKPIHFVNQLALNDINLTSRIQLTPDLLALNEMNLQFDQTHLKGDLWKKGHQNPQYQFNLAIDQLNMDAYQVKAIAQQQQAKPQGIIEGATAPHPIQAPLTQAYLPLAVPVRTLRALQAQGQLTIGKLQIWQQHYQKMNITLSAQKGLLKLAPFDANLYQGRIESQLSLNVTGQTPVYHWKGKGRDIQLMPFLQDGWHNASLKGTLSSYFDFKTQGVNQHLLKQNLNGRFMAKIEKGAVKGLDLNQLLMGKPSSKTDETAFKRLVIDGPIQKGIYHISKWKIDSSRFSGTGFGRVNLVLATLNTHLKLHVDKAPLALSQLKGLEVPIRLTGLLQHPKWQLQTKALLNNPQTQHKILEQIKQILGQ